MKVLRNWLILYWILLSVFLGWLFLKHTGMALAADNTQLIFTPIADAYVNQSSPSANYGGATQLRIDGSPLVYSYLRFSVSGLAGRPISKAIFQIYANSSSNGGYQVHQVNNNSWAENTINFTNAPSFNDILASSGPIASGHWIQVDVTSLITGEGPVSLALTDPGVTAVSLASRETNTNAPQLIVTVIDSTSPSDTPFLTSTPTPTNVSNPTDTTTSTPVATKTVTFTPTLTNTPTITRTPTLTGTRTISATPTLTFTLTPTATPSLTPSPQPTSDFTQTPGNNTVVLVPVADAYVDSSNPTVNHGTQTTIRVDGSPFVNSYLRFNVNGLNSPILQARLRIYANSASTSGISVAKVDDNTWVETGITYVNAPVIGSTFATSSAVDAGTWKEIDVTGLVSGNGLVSFGVETPGSTAISLASRESGTNAPQLIVTYPLTGQTSTNTPVSTPTNTPSRTPTNTPPAGNTPTNTPTGANTPTPNATSVVIMAAGDLTKCAGGTPSPTGGAMITSNMLLNDPGPFFTLGDNSNDTGTADDYEDCYGPTWGRLMNRTYPAMGNHDMIADPQGGPYFAYFSGMTGYYGHYSLNLGTWHIVVLNAECGVGSQGCESGNPQEVWLKQDLLANTQPCILAIWHQPLFTSGTQAETPGMLTFWKDLYAAGADIILNGHNHNYERFALQDPNRNPDPKGIREFVVGTGGASLDNSTKPLALNEELRSAAAYGYLKLTLQSNSYSWQFVAQPGASFTDSGSGACH